MRKFVIAAVAVGLTAFAAMAEPWDGNFRDEQAGICCNAALWFEPIGKWLTEADDYLGEDIPEMAQLRVMQDVAQDQGAGHPVWDAYDANFDCIDEWLRTEFVDTIFGESGDLHNQHESIAWLVVFGYTRDREAWDIFIGANFFLPGLSLETGDPACWDSLVDAGHLLKGNGDLSGNGITNAAIWADLAAAMGFTDPDPDRIKPFSLEFQATRDAYVIAVQDPDYELGSLLPEGPELEIPLGAPAGGIPGLALLALALAAGAALAARRPAVR